MIEKKKKKPLSYFYNFVEWKMEKHIFIYAYLSLWA